MQKKISLTFSKYKNIGNTHQIVLSIQCLDSILLLEHSSQTWSGHLNAADDLHDPLIALIWQNKVLSCSLETLYQATLSKNYQMYSSINVKSHYFSSVFQKHQQTCKNSVKIETVCTNSQLISEKIMNGLKRLRPKSGVNNTFVFVFKNWTLSLAFAYIEYYL